MDQPPFPPASSPLPQVGALTPLVSPLGVGRPRWESVVWQLLIWVGHPETRTGPWMQTKSVRLEVRTWFERRPSLASSDPTPLATESPNRRIRWSAGRVR